jgi:DNA-binding transcriptional ArsR family regulator
MADAPFKTVATVADTVPQDFFAKPSKLLMAVAVPVRWAMMRELAAVPSLSVIELGAKLGQSTDLVSKHLRVLRDAGALVVVAAPDGDGRKQHHAVPERFRRTDDAGRPVIDYGVCVLRFP